MTARRLGLGWPLRGRRLGAAVLLALAAACGDSGPARPPHVLLITLDTVRADHLGAYGYDARDVTPHLDAFAGQAVLFERAFANSSFTPPSHASLLTSLYPSEHGLMHWRHRLGDVPTAAELFAAEGYRTVAVTPLETLLVLGLERGFDTAVGVPHTEVPGGVLLADADAVNAAALPLLLADDERPVFAWLHYYDAHRVYGRQGPEWANRYSDFPDSSVGATEGYYQLPPERRPGRPRAQGDLSPEEVAYIRDRYDGGLAYLDDRIGMLLEALRADGLLDDAIVVITADHGEVLDEHDDEWFSHDPYLVEENVHVPLLLRLPGAAHAGLRSDALVQGVDVLPTLLELAGLDPLASAGLRGVLGGRAFSGRSLVPLLEGRRLGRDFVFADRMGKDRSGEGLSDAQVRAERDRRRMLRLDAHKLVHHVDRGTFELFAVDDEHTDLSARMPEQRDQLVARYVELVGRLRSTSGGDAALDEETRRLLISLGYIQDEGD